MGSCRGAGLPWRLAKSAAAHGFPVPYFYAIASRETNCVNELGDRFDLAHSLRYGQLPTVYMESDPKSYLASYVGTYRQLWDKLADPNFDVSGWQAMYRWVNDSVPFAGAAFRQWIVEFYQENRLALDTLEMDGNHHLHKPVMIGEVRGDGQFNVVWRTKTAVRAQPWSPYIAGNEGKPDVVSSIPEFLRRRRVA